MKKKKKIVYTDCENVYALPNHMHGPSLRLTGAAGESRPLGEFRASIYSDRTIVTRYTKVCFR